MPYSTPSTDALLTILRRVRRIAVVGASPNPVRPSYWISGFLAQQGYQVIPVNPGHEELFGLPCYPELDAIPDEVDVVNIFRRSDQVLPIVKAAVKRPGVQLIWMQDGVYNPQAADLASDAGIPVVMDDCIYRFLGRHRDH